MGTRHTMIRNSKLHADEFIFEVDADGRLVPDPPPELASRLHRLANFEPVADPEPAPAPKPKTKTKPKPKTKPKTTTRKRTKKES
jgi:hypothetical protein